MSIKKELTVVRRALKKDAGLYLSWQANIAMAFYDECHRAGIKHKNLHAAANDGAKRFLNQLIKG